jgi:hypothetical protein
MACDQLESIFEDVKTKNPKANIRVGFVGYRDIHDHEHFVIKDFTYEHRSITNVLAHTRAEGGGDVAEDVAGALKQVNQLSWKAQNKFVFHVADAPAHGTDYHENGVSDDYPQGTPSICLENEVRELANKGVNFTLIEIDSSTNKMREKMKKVYEDCFQLSQFKSMELDTSQTYEEQSHNLSRMVSTHIYSMCSNPDTP